MLGLVLVALAFARWAPFWSGHQALYLLDVLHQAYPWQAVVDLTLVRAPAAMPLWNSYSFCGSPLLADPQSQILYPPAILFRFLPFATAYGFWLAFHGALAAVGTAAFLLGRGLGPPAALLGVVGYAFGAHPSLLAFNAQTSAGYAWLPWVAVCASGLSSRPGVASAVALGIILAWTVLAGSLQHALIAGVLACFVLVAAFPIRRLRVFLSAGLAVALTLAVCSPMLWPAFRYIRYGTVRGFPLSPEAASLGEFPLRNLVGYLTPLSVWSREGGASALPAQWLGLHCVGSLVVVLAVVGLLARWRRIQGAVWLVAVGLGMGLGHQLPLAGGWLRQVPPLCYTRNSAMWLALADFGLAWAGAAGLEALRERMGRRTRVAYCIAGIVLFLTAGQLFWMGYALTPSAPAKAVTASTAEERFLVSAMKGVAWGRVMHWPPPWEPGTRVAEPVSGRDREDLVRNLRSGLMPNLPAALGCRAADGDNPLVPLGVGRLLTVLGFCGDAGSQGCRALLNLLGVRWLVSGRPLSHGLNPAFCGKSVIYELSGSREAAWVEPGKAGRITQAMETAPGSWVVALRAVAPCVLVVGETATTGWRLVAPRGEARIETAWGALLGVRLPAGCWRVRLAYDPVEARVGMLLSFLVLGVIVSFGGWRHK